MIDDVALGNLIKRSPAYGRCWLGFSNAVVSRRPYPRLAELWQMVTRSAFYQLRYSPVLLAWTIAGLLWLYLIPPVAALSGLIGVAVVGGSPASWCAAAGLAGSIMAVTYLPVLRLYQLSKIRAAALPLIALMYAAMTLDSARAAPGRPRRCVEGPDRRSLSRRRRPWACQPDPARTPAHPASRCDSG